jgi:uncharacterized membrane protein
MSLFLFRFWPVLLPFLIYILWFYTVGCKVTIDGKPVMRFRDGPWYWIVLSSLVIGIACMIYFGATTEGQKGDYVPPHMENGVLVPGHIGNAP